MITYSAAGYWIDSISRSDYHTACLGERFPEMTPETVADVAKRWSVATLRARFGAALDALTTARSVVAQQAARLVPAPLAARAEARRMTRDFARLEELAPHLLDDIGMQVVAQGVYATLKADETNAAPVAVATPVRPAPFSTPRPVKAVPRRAPRKQAAWPSADLAGAV